MSKFVLKLTFSRADLKVRIYTLFILSLGLVSSAPILTAEAGAGAAVQIAPQATDQALIEAVDDDQPAAATAALQAGANVDAAATVLVNGQEQSGWTALMLAAKHGHTAIVQLLLAAGANVNAAATVLVNGQARPDWTALMIAAERGHTAIVQLLLAAGANVDATATFLVNGQVLPGWTALMLAAESDRTAIVQLLLAAGANVDATATALANDQALPGWTALMLAAEHGHTAIVQLLLAAGANVDATATALVNGQALPGWTALMITAGSGHTAIVQLLLAAGAELSAAQELQLPGSVRTVIVDQQALLTTRAAKLLVAAAAGDMAQVTTLSALPLPNKPEVFNQAFLAVAENNELGLAQFAQLVEFLLDRHADINYRPPIEGGVTESETAKAAVVEPPALNALDLAIKQNNLERVQFLLEHGADPLQLAENTLYHLGAFTVSSLVQPAANAAALAALKERRRAELLASLPELDHAQQERYLTDAFTIAQLISDQIIGAQRAAGETRLMAHEDRA